MPALSRSRRPWLRAATVSAAAPTLWTASAKGTVSRQGRAHGRRGEVLVGDVQRRQQTRRRIEADGLRPALHLGHHAETAEQGGGGVVGMALEARGQLEDALAARAPPSRRTSAATRAATVAEAEEPEAARDRDVILHVHPPAQAGGIDACLPRARRAAPSRSGCVRPVGSRPAPSPTTSTRTCGWPTAR